MVRGGGGCYLTHYLHGIMTTDTDVDPYRFEYRCSELMNRLNILSVHNASGYIRHPSSVLGIRTNFVKLSRPIEREMFSFLYMKYWNWSDSAWKIFNRLAIGIGRLLHQANLERYTSNYSEGLIHYGFCTQIGMDYLSRNFYF